MIPNNYILVYEIDSLTTAVYNQFGDLQPEDTPVTQYSITPEMALRLVREERTKRLLESDWTQLPDSPLTPAQKSLWAVYRQALRDLPENVVWNVTKWPNTP